jgi:hypothetical protein
MRRTWHRVVGATDDSLPMPPDQRAKRDWTEASSETESSSRKLRLKLHLLEKRGKGGYR